MKIEITEKELNDIFKDKILEHLKKTVEDDMLEYWVRQEVHKTIADMITDDFIKKHFPQKKLEEMMKESFQQYVEDKFDGN